MAESLQSSALEHTTGALEGLRTGEHGWRNIPSIIRLSFAQIADAQASLSQVTQNLAALVARKASATSVADDISSCATVAQLQHLMEVVQRDVLPRFDSPCSAHGGTNAMLAAMTSRLAQLESIVSAQDKQLQSLKNEVWSTHIVETPSPSPTVFLWRWLPCSSPARRLRSRLRLSRSRPTWTTA